MNNIITEVIDNNDYESSIDLYCIGWSRQRYACICNRPNRIDVDGFLWWKFFRACGAQRSDGYLDLIPVFDDVTMMLKFKWFGQARHRASYCSSGRHQHIGDRTDTQA